VCTGCSKEKKNKVERIWTILIVVVTVVVVVVVVVMLLLWIY